MIYIGKCEEELCETEKIISDVIVRIKNRLLFLSNLI